MFGLILSVALVACDATLFVWEQEVITQTPEIMASTENKDVPTAAIASAVMGQAAPTIVWHGVVTQDASDTYTRQYPVLMGAWSNGQVEAKKFYMGQFSSSWCNNNFTACSSNWYVINDPAQGLAAASDSNFDAQVDGADLALLLGNRGDAPRDQIPSSDCPLNLINP